jgi:hypothetical protein
MATGLNRGMEVGHGKGPTYYRSNSSAISALVY